MDPTMDGQGPTTATPDAPAPAAAPSPAPAPAAAPSPAPAPAAPAAQPEVQHLAPGQNDQIDPADKAKKESWGSNVYHGILNALGGSNDVTLARDPATGKMVATAVKSGPGTQWKRIISGAIAGAGAAEAGGGTGPGSTARKFGLGIQGGAQLAEKHEQQQRQDANEDFEMQQKAATSNAQNALLSHQIAESTFRLGRQKVTATEADAERETNFTKLISAGGEGSQDLGVFPDFAAVVAHFKEMPQLHDHQAQGQLVTIPHVDGSGKVDGVHVALVTPDWQSAKYQKDFPVTVDTIKDGKKVEETFMIPGGAYSQGDIAKLVMAQGKDRTEQWMKEMKEEREAGRAKAENAKDYAAADKDRAEGRKADADANAWSDSSEAATGGAGDAGMSLVDSIGTGHINPGRLSYLLARKPELMAAVVKKYPDFNDTKVNSYTKISREFTSGKIADQLNSGGAALRHMNELKALNTSQSHNPMTAAYTAYQNKAHTVAVELSKFYGNPTIPAIEKIESTLLTQLPGKRDAAILTQAKSMSDKFDEFENQWKEAAPSAAYYPLMPQMSAAALAARENLDPDFKAQQIEKERMGTIMRPSGAGAGPGAGKSISLTDAMNLPQFKGQSPAQVKAAAEALHYTVTQ